MLDVTDTFCGSGKKARLLERLCASVDGTTRELRESVMAPLSGRNRD